MSSDVCKHCTQAACLEVCPTGALFRTEFGTVVVQDDVCNGCGYCVPACPFGVIDRRDGARRAGRRGVHKCTLCYDRLEDGMTPACAKACPTESIQFGAARRAARARGRAARRPCRAQGYAGARLYGDDPATASAGSGRSSCCSTSPRSTGCRPTPVDRRAGSARCGGAPRRPASLLAAVVALSALRGPRDDADAPAHRRATTATPTTAARSSSRPSGSPTSAGTSSPAASRAPRRCSGSPRGCAATRRSRAAARWSRRGAVGVSPPLLIADLGRPRRFLNMLRVAPGAGRVGRDHVARAGVLQRLPAFDGGARGGAGVSRVAGPLPGHGLAGGAFLVRRELRRGAGRR